MKIEVMKLFDHLRDSLSIEEIIKPITVGVLLKHLERQGKENYIERIIKAGEEGQQELSCILQEIEKEIPYFKGVFDQLKSSNRIKASEMSVFWFDFDRLISSVDDLNSWFDECIEVYNSNVGKMGGGNSTPSTINELAIKLLEPLEGSFHDSMAGLGGSLRAAIKYSNEHSGKLKISGQEINPHSWAIVKIRMFLSGQEDAQILLGDIISNPQFVEKDRLEKFDFIFIDSPFGLAWNPDADQYNRFLYGTPPKSNIEMAAISHALVSLKQHGKAIVVVSSGTLFRSGTTGRIRNNIIASDLIEAVIGLPAGLYDNTGIPANLILLNKNKDHSRKNRILFINAEDAFEEISRRKKILSSKGMEKIIRTYREGVSIQDFSKMVVINQLNEGNLAPNQYVIQTQMEMEPYGMVEFSPEALRAMKTVPLNELATFFRGYNVRPGDEAENGKYRVVKISDVQDGKLDAKNLSRYNITKNAKLDDYRLHKGDVIVSVRGQTIKVAEIEAEDEGLLISQNFLGIRCGKRLNPTYLKMYLESPVGQYLLTSKITGSVIPTLNKKDLEQLKVPVKPIEEQNDIVEAYLREQETLLKQIEQLQKRLYESKMVAYKDMGLSEVFTITE